MWIFFSFLSAITSGLSVVFQKKGSSGNRALHVSAINSLSMLGSVFLVAIFTGSLSQWREMSLSCWMYTISSGLIQAASWLTYFLALRSAQVSFLMVLDKANIVLTMLLAWALIDEPITPYMVGGTAFILIGTILMMQPIKNIRDLFGGSNRWIFWGILSPSLQAVSNILAKLDRTPVNTTLTTTIRLLVVAVVLCSIFAISECILHKATSISAKDAAFLIAGGAILGISYILMYQAIYDGIAAVVTPIVRSGFLVSTLLAYVFLKERLTRRGWIGFAIVFAGVMMFLF